MQKLGRDNADNALLQGRGQPGTHDMALGTSILEALKRSPSETRIALPVYDKSRHNGLGDRSSDTVGVTTPLDVVILEGWCMGFYPVSPHELQRQYEEATSRGTMSARPAFYAAHPLSSLAQINELLQAYLAWYAHVDAFVQLKPDDLHNVFAWRLQAEHAMKAAGKDGMSDEEVHEFVAR